MWEALQVPDSEPSDDDELVTTEDGEVNTPGSTGTTQRARDGRTKATRVSPVSAPPAFASTSTAVVDNNSRSQMKRKELEPLFTSKKRTRYVPTAHSDQDDAIDLDLDEQTKFKRHMGINSRPAPRPAPEQKTRQPGASLSVSSKSMNRNDRASPINPKPNLMRKSSGMKPPQFPKKNLSKSALAESIRPGTRDPPSKLTGLPFDAYKRSQSKTVPVSDPGRSVVSTSPVEKKFDKASIKHRRVPSTPQTKQPSTSKSPIPSDAEIIEISDDDDSPPPSVSQAKSKSKSIIPPNKKSLPKPSKVVIEIFDTDDEQLPSKAQPPEKNVIKSSPGLLQESTTGSNPRGDQSRHSSPLGGEGSDGKVDVMDVDDGDLFNIPSSPRALSQELQVANDANDNQIPQAFIPLPSSSPSSVGLSPKDNYLPTPVPTSPVTSLAIPSPRQLPTRPNSAQKPITADPTKGTSTGSSSNRLGFSTVAISSPLQAPPPADKHRRQFARKMAIQSMPDEVEDTEDFSSSKSEGTANIKVNKGKGKEIREPSSSSSGTESISMRGLRDALAMGPDKLKQRLVSPPLLKRQRQTLAEAITSAGLLNRTKRMRHRLERNTKDVPVDPTSDEVIVKDGPKAGENEKALKAAIGSSKLLVNLLPALKGKSSATATAAKASSPKGEKLPSSPTRTQDFHPKPKLVPPESPSPETERSSYPLSPLSSNPNIHDVPFEKPLFSLEMRLGTDSSDGKIFASTVQPKTEPSTAFKFKSGTAVITPHKTKDLEDIQTPTTPPSIHPPASSSNVHTNPNDAAVQDESLRTLGLPSDDSPDDEEKECQALLQSSNMDVAPSHDVQSSSGDSIVVRHKSPIDLDASVEVPSPLESLSATSEVFNESASVSPLMPEVPTRRSSRLSSNRSSLSTSSEGFGIAFDFDSGPSNSVPVSRTSTPEVQEPSALPSPGKTYGGFRALTWKDFRKDLNNFTPKTYYAKDLPHSLQDHINSMSEYTQMMQGMRDLFKATILENTVEDEPDAPPIEIWNNVDTQTTPPWEFYYTNHMWLGEGVPPPDITTLLSCSCKGGCNPKSKTCACLLRQRELVGDPQLEFAYDKNGRLKIPGYPIFECNDLCGCSDECRNRVVQQGRKVAVSIGKTEMKGWGVFAGPKKIPEGTFIGIYSGELLTDAEAQERGIKYNKSGRTYLFDIDFHHLNDGSPSWENTFTVDAYHAGNFTRFLNHSCDPNCRLYACYINEGNIQKPLLAIFSRRDIEPYEEICFNYQGDYDDGDDDDEEEDDENRNLDPDREKDMIYVTCRCGAKNCTGTMFK